MSICSRHNKQTIFSGQNIGRLRVKLFLTFKISVSMLSIRAVLLLTIYSNIVRCVCRCSRLMGEVDPKKKRFMPRPKKKAPPPVEEAEKAPENAAPN